MLTERQTNTQTDITENSSTLAALVVIDSHNLLPRQFPKAEHQNDRKLTD